MKAIYLISLVLSIIGSINWGLVGIADVDLVKAIFGADSMLTRMVYIVVGLGGVVLILTTLIGLAALNPVV